IVSSSRRHTRSKRDWSSDVCSSDLWGIMLMVFGLARQDQKIGKVGKTEDHEHDAPLDRSNRVEETFRLPDNDCLYRDKQEHIYQIGRASCRERGLIYAWEVACAAGK